MTKDDVAKFNRRSQQGEQLVARSLFTAGITWPGVALWDDLRTVDYLASRPEVDPARIGCVGLSMGGYRSFLLAALEPRIKVAVDVGWMTSFAAQIRKHVVHTIGLVVPHRRPLPLSGSAGSGGVDCSTRGHGHQRLEGLAVCARRRPRRIREDRGVLPQGGRRRAPAVPHVRHAARVQSGDAGRGVGLDREDRSVHEGRSSSARPA